jgi:hypothetical protein
MKKTITFKHFDAELNTDVCDAYNNAELTLTLRMGFRQINPTGGNATGTHHDYGDVTAPTRKIIKWTSSAWTKWQTNFVSSAQAFWHGKFWLINDAGSFPCQSGGLAYYPNVWCRFKLVGQEASAANNHHTIDVVRLDPSEKWFGSHSTLYDSRDTDSVQKATTSKNKKVMQRAHVHEVGHLLGYNHVDVGKAHCPAAGDTNASACYGISDTDMQSVMGSGMKLGPELAYPWRESLRQFALEDLTAGLATATLLATKGQSLLLPIATIVAVWPAQMRRHYPRTDAELKANAAITSPPKRPK